MTKREIILSIRITGEWTEDLIKYYMRKYTKEDLIRMANWTNGVDKTPKE